MTFSYEPSTELGQVRLLIPDKDEGHVIFQDEEIQVFLDMNDTSPRRAAAEALETIASDQAMVLKVISLLDLRTDGVSLAKELRERASRLRELAAQADAEDEALFDWAETADNAFQKRERVWKQAQRNP